MTEYIVGNLTELNNILLTVLPGDVVRLRGGTYQPTDQIIFSRSGLQGSPITFEAIGKVVFEGSLATLTSEYVGLLSIVGDWNILRNIEERYSPGTGIRVDGADCILDHVETHHNNGCGANAYGNRCKFLYVSSHHNADPLAAIPGGDADGLGASGRSSGSYFFRCLTYANSDDGIDVFGSSGHTIEQCVSHSNGLLQGDGDGFKLMEGGGNVVTRSIAYNNRLHGFSPANQANNIEHCTAFNNGQPGFITYGELTHLITLADNIGTVEQYDAKPTERHNTWNLGITDPGFVSTDPSSPDFLALRSDSPCRGKASDGTDIGALQYGERISDLIGGTKPSQAGFPWKPVAVVGGIVGLAWLASRLRKKR